MKCFADRGDICTALQQKDCNGCNFFKSEGQKLKDDETTEKRLSFLKDKVINIFS